MVMLELPHGLLHITLLQLDSFTLRLDESNQLPADEVVTRSRLAMDHGWQWMMERPGSSRELFGVSEAFHWTQTSYVVMVYIYRMTDALDIKVHLRITAE
jgi:hypothetical protein